MKNRFHISSIKVTGPAVRESEIHLEDGLNIIEGGSDTGKTSIVHCILYIFDKSWRNKSNSQNRKKFPFLDTYGYTKVAVTFQNNEGTVTISREKDASKVIIDSTVTSISSGQYSFSSKTKGHNLNDVFLSMMGINERHSVPKNKNYETQMFTWKGISSLWYVDENNIIQGDPIMLPTYQTQETSFLSSLIFMITGKDIEIPEGIKNPKIKKAKDQATKGQLTKQLQESSKKIQEIHSKIENENYSDAKEQLQLIIKKIDNLNEQIYERINEIHSIQQNVSDIDQQIEEMTVYIARFKNLRSEYIGDIKRLSFIVNGEQQLESIQVKHKCPFCNQTINLKQSHDHTKAAQAELKRIMGQLEGLEKSTADVKNRKYNLEKDRENKQILLEQLSQKLKAEMKPTLIKLKEQQDKYQNWLILKNQERIYKDLISEWSAEVNKIDSEKTKNPEYHPRDHFPEDFVTKISNIAYDLLKTCGYSELENVRFDIKDFELEINGVLKSDNHGKGYRAYFKYSS